MTARPKPAVPLVSCMVAAISRAQEILTIRDFVPVCAVSLRTLQRHCDDLGITLTDCKHFVWCARAVLSATRIWDPDAELTSCCKDPRTREELIERGGLDTPSRPTFSQFLERQQILTVPSLLAELRTALQGVTTGLLLCCTHSISVAIPILATL